MTSLVAIVAVAFISHSVVLVTIILGTIIAMLPAIIAAIVIRAALITKQVHTNGLTT
jgi:hypothetical protein